MADVLPADTAAAPAPDIENMSDEDFAKFKETLTDEAPAPKEEPEPPPAASGDDDDDADAEPTPGSQTVPHAKFHRANERRKAEAARAEKAEQTAALAMQRMTELLEAARPAPQPQPEPEAAPEDPGPRPDPVNDPYNYTIWRARKDDFDEYQNSQRQKEWEAGQAREQGWQRALGETTAQFAQAKAAKPELQGLYDGLRESYAKEFASYFEAMGQPVNPMEIQQRVANQEAQIIAWAYQNRVPIAAVIERMAAARGVTAAAELKPTPERDPVTGKFKSAAELEKLERTKQAAKSLGGGGAPARTDTPSAEDILNMSDADFAAFKKKHGDRAMRIAMGAA